MIGLGQMSVFAVKGLEPTCPNFVSLDMPSEYESSTVCAWSKAEKLCPESCSTRRRAEEATDELAGAFDSNLEGWAEKLSNKRELGVGGKCI